VSELKPPIRSKVKDSSNTGSKQADFARTFAELAELASQDLTPQIGPEVKVERPAPVTRKKMKKYWFERIFKRRTIKIRLNYYAAVGALAILLSLGFVSVKHLTQPESLANTPKKRQAAPPHENEKASNIFDVTAETAGAHKLSQKSFREIKTEVSLISTVKAFQETAKQLMQIPPKELYQSKVEQSELKSLAHSTAFQFAKVWGPHCGSPEKE